jgi:hypothetical protein
LLTKRKYIGSREMIRIIQQRRNIDDGQWQQQDTAQHDQRRPPYDPRSCVPSQKQATAHVPETFGQMANSVRLNVGSC